MTVEYCIGVLPLLGGAVLFPTLLLESWWLKTRAMFIQKKAHLTLDSSHLVVDYE